MLQGIDHGRYTHINSSDFAIHELVLCCSSLKPVSRQLHGIPSIVNVGEDLHGNHGLRMLRHFVYGRQLVDDIVSKYKPGQ
jgi:hypothetical protein